MEVTVRVMGLCRGVRGFGALFCDTWVTHGEVRMCGRPCWILVAAHLLLWVVAFLMVGIWAFVLG